MIFRAIYLFFSYRRGGWSAQMEIQLHRYIEKAVLECCYWNPGHQSQASICCAPLYLTLTTMHLTFSFSFFLSLVSPWSNIESQQLHSFGGYVCEITPVPASHTHSSVGLAKRKSNENQRRGRVMDIYVSAVLKTASCSCKTQSPSRCVPRTELRLHSEESGSTLHAALWGKFHDSKFSTSKVMCEVPVPTVTTKAISTCLHGSQCLQG